MVRRRSIRTTTSWRPAHSLCSTAPVADCFATCGLTPISSGWHSPLRPLLREERDLMSESQQPRTSDDLGHFFRGWIRNPLAIGAFAPSGKSLAKLMAKDVGAGA